MFKLISSSPKKLLNIFDSISNILVDVNLFINKDGIFIKQMDASHICYTFLELNCSEFDEYYYNYLNNDTIKIGIKLKNLVSILTVSRNCNTIELSISNLDKLNVISVGREDTKEFELNLMDIPQQFLDIPSCDYNCEFKVSSELFNSLIDTCEIMEGDFIRFEIKDKNLKIESTGSVGNYKQFFKSEKKNMFTIKNSKLSDNIDKIPNCTDLSKDSESLDNYILNTSENNFNINLSLNMISLFKKMSKLTDYLDININPESPVRFDFMINYETGSIIHMFLAPKIEED